MLKGAGVGDETATTLAAALAWLVRDGVGHVGRITFAYARGTDLDSDCKKWRLAADVLNDAALLLDMCAAWAPRNYFTAIVCVSSVCRACVGVAGGASRTPVTQHHVSRFVTR